MEDKNWPRQLLQLFAGEEAQTQPAEEPQSQGAAPQAPDYAAHFRELERQGRALAAVFPGFDLRRELQDPLFARLTAPNVGLGVEDAFYTVHRRQIQAASMEAAARNTALQFSNAVRSGALRPRENGAADQAPSVSTFDYRAASREQREDLKRRIRQAKAEGRRIYPGQG